MARSTMWSGRWLNLAVSTAQTRPATAADEPFLWHMLTYAASMSGSDADVAAAKADPELASYVTDFGRAGDLGVVALIGRELVGAAWGRLLVGEPKPSKVWTHDTPELAIATLPSARGRGVGSLLLGACLDGARGRFPAVVLSVREDNPAVRLYERHGFVVERRLVNRVGTVSLAMRCALGA
jgi:ribosomal protein S18 acetylase RimI-like enzyme